MKNINLVFLLGNVSRDPVVKEIGTGKIVSFSVATNSSRRDRTGKTISETQFHDCVAFGGVAQICADFLQKGQLVHIEGHLQTRSFIDENGEKRNYTEVVAASVIILSKYEKKNSSQNSTQNFSGNSNPSGNLIPGDSTENSIPNSAPNSDENLGEKIPGNSNFTTDSKSSFSSDGPLYF